MAFNCIWDRLNSWIRWKFTRGSHALMNKDTGVANDLRAGDQVPSTQTPRPKAHPCTQAQGCVRPRSPYAHADPGTGTCGPTHIPNDHKEAWSSRKRQEKRAQKPHEKYGNIILKVAKHPFGSLWVYVICQIMARGRLQLTSGNLASENLVMKHFDWQVKFDVFVVSMATWTIEYNLQISLLISLHKICSLDFPINLHTTYYN